MPKYGFGTRCSSDGALRELIDGQLIQVRVRECRRA